MKSAPVGTVDGGPSVQGLGRRSVDSHGRMCSKGIGIALEKGWRCSFEVSGESFVSISVEELTQENIPIRLAMP